MSRASPIKCIYAIAVIGHAGLYIGQTRDFRHRRRGHLDRLRRGCHSNPYLQNVFNQYGESCFFMWPMSPTGEASDAEVTKLEQYYIDVFHTNIQSGGYNIREAGESHKATTEARAKMRLAARGRKAAPETRAKMSATRKGRKGHKPTAEVRAKISAALKGRKHSFEARVNMSAVQLRRRAKERRQAG